VIRQVPNLSDPYHTLGALHEVMDQPRQALNFYMIAAHMSGKVGTGRSALYNLKQHAGQLSKNCSAVQYT
jgi:hypothetical protein